MKSLSRNKSSGFSVSIYLLVLLLLCAAVVSLPLLLDWVDAAGVNIAWRHDVRGDYFKAIGWAAVITVSIVVWPVPIEDKPLLIMYWLIKVLIVLGFMLVYENVYQVLDAFNFFKYSVEGEFSFDSFAFGAGTENLINFTRLHNLFIKDSYHALKVSFAFIGMLSVYLIYRSVSVLIDTDSRVLFWIIALVPSVLFWTSILGKDPLVFFGLALFIWGVIFWYRTQSLYFLLFAALGIFLAMSIRIWLAPIFILPTLFLVLGQVKSVMARIGISVLVVGFAALSIETVMEYFTIETTEDLLNKTDVFSQAWATGGSANVIESGFKSFGDLLAFLPVGAFTALFRPLPGEIMHAFGLLSGVENLLLLILFISALYFVRISGIKDPVIAWLLSTIVLWAAFYSVISYQNLGTAVRFKTQILPVMMTFIIYAIHKHRQRKQLETNTAAEIAS